MPNEKDPKDYFVQPLRCPRTANGNTKRVLVVYALTPGVHVVHACEYEGHVLGSLLPWAGEGDPRGWESRLGEVIEVPAKVAKEYLERSRKLALRAIDAATKSVTFVTDTHTLGHLSAKGAISAAATPPMTFKSGERISATDVETGIYIASVSTVRFTYRGVTCHVKASTVEVSP